MAHKIQDELDQVERQVYILEKEENELRRVRKKTMQTLCLQPCFTLLLFMEATCI